MAGTDGDQRTPVVAGEGEAVVPELPGERANFADGTGWGPYAPWARPHVLLARDRGADALRRIPEPLRDLLFEALWCLTGQAAIALDDRALRRRAHTELASAAQELAGAGSGMLTAGPVRHHLDRLAW